MISRRPFLRHFATTALPLVLGFGIAVAAPIACSSGDSPGSGGDTHFLLTVDNALLEVEGGDRKTLVSFPDSSFLLDPLVSADGKRIVFVRQPPAGIAANGGVDFGSDVWIANRDGSDRKEIVRHSVTGEFIRTPVFLTDEVILFGVRGRKPDGAQAFYIDSLDLVTNERRRVLDDGIDPLVVSPDGAWISYLYIDPATQSELLMAAASDFRTPTPLAGTPNGLGLIQSTVWSPDGTRLAFTAVDLTQTAAPDTPPPRTQLAHPFAQDLWVVNRDGSGLSRLAELQESQVSIGWSRDGVHIFALGQNGFWQITVADGAREQVGAGVPLGQLYWLSP